MEGKGFVKVLGIALTLICLYYLSLTFFANNVERKANNYAEEKIGTNAFNSEQLKEDALRKERRRYMDSVANKPALNLGVVKYTYDELCERRINLGLDLQGGMSVTLQVSLEELIRSMANNSTDPAFLQALKTARDQQNTSQDDFVTLFGRAYEQAAPGAKLGAIFNAPEYKDKITFNSSNADVLNVIRDEAKQAVQRTYEIMRSRIDKFGVTSPNIQLQPGTDRIVVELPGVDEPERVRKLLQASAKLEFWEVAEMSNDLAKLFGDANKIVKDELEDMATGKSPEAKADNPAQTSDSTATATNADTSKVADALAANDTATAAKDTSLAARRKENPLFAVFQPSPNPGGVIGYINGNDTATFNNYMNMPAVRPLFASENLKFVFTAKPVQDENAGNVYMVYALKGRGNNMKAPLEGDVIVDARQDVDANQDVVVSMQMNADGAKRWRKLTADNIKKPVAIVLDDLVYSAPTVQNEIAGGNSQITGSFSISEAQDLANILKAGKLPAPARIVEEAVVGPSLGKESIAAGLASLIAGLIGVMLFMVAYYRGGGVVAVLVLLINLLFMMGVLASIGATLTLPGMAGIVLTMGIAVDANVLIFERIREELAHGVGLREAINIGYSKSMSAIIDSNLTTLITAVILAIFGLGPVLGFATILIIGIITSMFTAILLSRYVIEWWLDKGNDIKYSSSWSEGAFKNVNFDFVGKRRIGYMIAAAIMGLGIIGYFANGFQYGVDFSGGRSYVVRFDQATTANEIREALTAPLEGTPVVTTYGGGNQFKITTKYLVNDESAASDIAVAEKLYNGLAKFAGGKSGQEFAKTHVISSQKVGPTVADDITRSAIWATIIASLGIGLYILLRFRKWQFSVAAAATVFHDALMVLAFFALLPGVMPFPVEIDQHFIAAILTVMGYSINDTVVIFDRIREYLRENPNEDQKTVINYAINSTLSRTVITSGITFLTVLVLFLFGGEVLRGFSFALLIGILLGTYSSIFIATPLVIDLAKNDTLRTPDLKEVFGAGETEAATTKV
jgi:SecD/SecF fusion protein